MTELVTDVELPAILEALERHEREVSRTFATVLGGRVEDRPDMLAYATGLPASFANGVKAPRLDEASADGAIHEVSAMLREAGVVGTWSVGPLATPADLGERLERSGLRLDFDLLWMAAEIADLDLTTDVALGLRIQRVDDESLHHRWLRVMEQGFGMPEPVTRTIDVTARAVGFDGSAPWIRFVGTIDGQAVASSGLMLFGGLAGVYNVATLPNERRRGFGAAMTKAAIRYGRDLGYRAAVLGASDMGRGIYERMGFRDITVVRQFVFDPVSV